MSIADEIFIENCKDILSRGQWDRGEEVRPRWEDGSPAHTIRLFGVVNRYDLQEEFPVMTLRTQYLSSAVDELLWIWQKKSNQVSELSTKIWDAWADESGSIGKAYGYQLGEKFGFGELSLDQVDYVLHELRHNRNSRRMVTNLFVHRDLNEMALYPCAHSMTFQVCHGRLNGILNQRSQDMLTANGWNVMQYATLLHFFAQVSGLAVGELVHVIADCHIYDRHVGMVEEMLLKKPFAAPKMVIDETVTDFYQFTKNSVKLEGYESHPLEGKIPVAI